MGISTLQARFNLQYLAIKRQESANQACLFRLSHLSEETENEKGSIQLGPLLRKLVAGMTLRWRKALFFKYWEMGQREMTLPLPTDPHSPSSLKTSWPLCMVSAVTLHPEGNLCLVSTHAPKTAEPCPAAVLLEHETEVWSETLQFPDWILERQWEILVSCFLRTPESYYLLKKSFWFTVTDSM